MGPRRSTRKKARPSPYITKKVGSNVDKENDPLVNHHEIPVPDAGRTCPMDVDEVGLPPSQALPVPAETGELTPRLATRPTDGGIVIARVHSTYDDLTDVESNGECSAISLPSYDHR
jgi:hypothetical protein